MKFLILILMFSFAQTVSAQVFINEIQVSPIGERFIELYNSGDSNINLTGWYIQRKTATGSSFSSLITSTELKDKIINSNDYFLISRGQLANPDVVIDNLTLTESNTVRLRNSKGEDVGQIELAVIGDGKSYQRKSSNEWIVGIPTPGFENSVSQSVNVASQTSVVNNATAPTSAVSQVVAQAGPQTRTVLAGAPIIFEGKIAGLENNNGVTKTTWSFGDGASAESESVSHTYYYPGEYMAVLDVVSGSLTATDKMLVRVVLPNLSMTTGGDSTRSFFTIKNNGSDELDISGWQMMSESKTFTFPKNTILGARKSATFASEVTGLTTLSGEIVKLLFPNGSRVETKVETVVAQPVAPKAVEKQKVVASAPLPVVPQTLKQQSANVIDAVSDTSIPVREDKGLWPWYIGSAFLGALALLGLRLTQKVEEKATITAEDFEIIEETDDEEPH